MRKLRTDALGRKSQIDAGGICSPVTSSTRGRRHVVEFSAVLCYVALQFANEPSFFEFGANSQSFSSTVTDKTICEAERGLQQLFSNGELTDVCILDLGCGSGLAIFTASRPGASHVHGSTLIRNRYLLPRAL